MRASVPGVQENNKIFKIQFKFTNQEKYICFQFNNIYTEHPVRNEQKYNKPEAKHKPQSLCFSFKLKDFCLPYTPQIIRLHVFRKYTHK